MKVLIINTSERAGGAAVASRRLKDALSNNGLKARMLVAHKETDDPTVVEMPGKLRQRIHFLWERWCVFWHLHFQRDHLFELDLANAGTDITTLPAFREADIIQLEWINQGMLSLASIRKILRSGKPVVWTLHDLWPATGICHVTSAAGRIWEVATAANTCPNLKMARTWRHASSTGRRHSTKGATSSLWLAANGWAHKPNRAAC